MSALAIKDVVAEYSTEIFQQIRLGFVWSTNRRRDFYLMAANFIEDGKPVYDTLQVLEQRWRETGDGRANTLSAMMAAMRGNNGVAKRMGESMTAWAPTMEAMAVDAGEQSGAIEEGLRMSARLADTSVRIRNAVMGELIYPIFLLAALLVGLLAIKNFLIPVFEGISRRAFWPPMASNLGLLADNAAVLAIGVVVVIATVAIAFVLTRGRWKGEAREFFDRWIPPWTIHRRVSSAILMACFANFLKAGIPFSSVIAQLMATSSSWERNQLETMRNRMRQGMRDGDAMATQLFDEDIRWEIAVYGTTTGFSTALTNLSDRVTSRVITRVVTSASIARFIIMLSVAGMLIWIYGSFFEITMAARRPGAF